MLDAPHVGHDVAVPRAQRRGVNVRLAALLDEGEDAALVEGHFDCRRHESLAVRLGAVRRRQKYECCDARASSDDFGFGSGIRRRLGRVNESNEVAQKIVGLETKRRD